MLQRPFNQSNEGLLNLRQSLDRFYDLAVSSVPNGLPNKSQIESCIRESESAVVDNYFVRNNRYRFVLDIMEKILISETEIMRLRLVDGYLAMVTRHEDSAGIVNAKKNSNAMLVVEPLLKDSLDRLESKMNDPADLSKVLQIRIFKAATVLAYSIVASLKYDDWQKYEALEKYARILTKRPLEHFIASQFNVYSDLVDISRVLIIKEADEKDLNREKLEFIMPSYESFQARLTFSPERDYLSWRKKSASNSDLFQHTRFDERHFDFEMKGNLSHALVYVKNDSLLSLDKNHMLFGFLEDNQIKALLSHFERLHRKYFIQGNLVNFLNARGSWGESARKIRRYLLEFREARFSP